MPTPTREQIITALFNKLTPLAPGTFVTVQRGLVLPGGTGFLTLTQPILCLYKPPADTENFFRTRGLPAKREWEYWIVMYCKTPQPGVVAWDTIFDPLADAVEDALAPDTLPENRLTLGGLVDDCRLDGKALIGNGDTDSKGQGVGMFPVKIIVP
jgi:hypothetical protein